MSYNLYYSLPGHIQETIQDMRVKLEREEREKNITELKTKSEKLHSAIEVLYLISDLYESYHQVSPAKDLWNEGRGIPKEVLEEWFDPEEFE